MTDVNPIDLYKPPLATGDEKALLLTRLRCRNGGRQSPLVSGVAAAVFCCAARG